MYNQLLLMPNIPDNQSVTSDGFRPEDSESKISFVKENNSRLHSQVSRVSSTSSARIKAEADKAALMERMTALKMKHLLEAKEEELRKEKEQLALETDLAAANAKLRVLEINLKCGSKGSDGMNSYFERNKQRTGRLNPHADHFIPEHTDTKNIHSESHSELQAQIVRPKKVEMKQSDTRLATGDTQTQRTQMVHDAQQIGRLSYLNSAHNDNPQNDIVSIMQ